MNKTTVKFLQHLLKTGLCERRGAPAEPCIGNPLDFYVPMLPTSDFTYSRRQTCLDRLILIVNGSCCYANRPLADDLLAEFFLSNRKKNDCLDLLDDRVGCQANFKSSSEVRLHDLCLARISLRSAFRR